MREAETVVDGQPLRRLPVILSKSFPSVIRDIVNTIEASFLIERQRARRLVGVTISKGIGSTGRTDTQESVGVVAGGLGVPDPLPEETSFDGVGANHLGERVAEARHLLVGIET